METDRGTEGDIDDRWQLSPNYTLCTVIGKRRHAIYLSKLSP